MLHVAAQGDSPLSIAYFQNKGININSRDIKKRTPLHWAAFQGSELSISYILAFGAEINSLDINGMTPLHFGIKNYRQHKSSRLIK